jgi:hypothetical protein
MQYLSPGEFGGRTGSRSREGAAQYLLAFPQSLTRQFGAPVTLYFLKVADRYFDRSKQINRKIVFTFGPSVAKPDDFSTQYINSRIVLRRMRTDP